MRYHAKSKIDAKVGPKTHHTPMSRPWRPPPGLLPCPMRGAILSRVLPVEADALMAGARRSTGLDDFGQPPPQKPLRVLSESCEREAGLTLFGRLAMRGDIQRMLVNRLRIQEDRRRLPAIAGERIERPLFITGLPRTGTTLLHALLALDPAHRAPLTWETMYPSPPPYEGGRDDSAVRIKRTARRLRWLDRLAPRFQAIHEVGAELPQECIAIMAHTFISLRFLVTHRLPEYAEYLSRADDKPAYEFHRRFLQHLQFQASPRRWVLKAPAHLPALGALLAVYPDARIIQTHRDPMESIPSLASLRTELRQCFAREVDPAVVGPEVAAYWARSLERAGEVRQQADTGHFYDVRYEDLMNDPLGTLRALYDRLGLAWSREVETRMRNYLDANPQGKHGRHHYRLQHFGLETASIGRLYAQYRTRMGWAEQPQGLR